MSTRQADGSYWRAGSSSVASRAVHYGFLTGGPTFTTAAIPANMVFSMPIVVARSGTILDALTLRITASASGVQGQLALYGVSCLSVPLPTYMVAQAGGYAAVGTIPVCSLGTQIVSFATPTTGGFAIGGWRLYWPTVVFAGSATVTVMNGTGRWAFFGYDATSLSVPLSCITTSWDGTVTLPGSWCPSSFTIVGSSPIAVGLRVLG